MKLNPSTIEQVNIPNTPYRFFVHIIGKHKGWATLAVLAVVVAAGASAASSYFFKLIIDAVESSDLEAALMWGLLYPFYILITQLVYRISGYAGAHRTNDSNRTATNVLMAYILKHSHSYFIDRFAGSISNKIKNVTSAFDEMIPDILWAHLNAVVALRCAHKISGIISSNAEVTFFILLLIEPAKRSIK